MFRFSIRDVLWLTVMVALVMAWWVDRSRLASRAKETESFQALSATLTQQLQNKNPASSIEINVNGRGIVTSTSFADPNR
jgi:hypothetical protein